VIFWSFAPGDLINGSPGAKDQNITAVIFRKSDNALMELVLMPLMSEDRVSYTQPSCSQGEIITNKLVYYRDITLDPSVYNHPAGYYVSWQRCCRNYDITNIYSEIPGAGGGIAAGQTFYLEFPPVVIDGEPFINSSPSLFPPLNDYACPRRPYYADFAGTDEDGDSLVYSLVTPLNTKTSDAVPPTSSAPYPLVTWRPGYSLSKVTGGNPDLSITTEGLLTVTPLNQGLYVFAVKCEEFRAGRKIGEVRRDFQMLVLDRCPRAVPPLITGKKITDAGYTYQDRMEVTFPAGTTDTDRCISVKVSDADSQSADDFFKENIRLKVVGLNFQNSKLNEILPAISTAVLNNGSTKEFQVCFPDCPYINQAPFEIGLIAQDDACSLPLSDTLRVRVSIQLPPNVPPLFTTPNVSAVLKEGDKQSWPVEVYDPDGDTLKIDLNSGGSVLAQAGMKFQYVMIGISRAIGTFEWDAYCDLFDFTNSTDFNIRINANDLDFCRAQTKDASMELGLKVLLPGNASPVIDSDLEADESDRLITNIKREVFQELEFNVVGTDTTDNDFLELTMTGIGFNPAQYGMTFQDASGRGSLASTFRWKPDCNNVNPDSKTLFDLRFLVVDNSNKCKLYKADTLEVQLVLEPPSNRAPTFTFQSLNPDVISNGTALAGKPGDEFRFRLIAADGDNNPLDRITLSLADATGNVEPQGYSFRGAEGVEFIESLFSWTPGCEAFQNGEWENNYTFQFRAADNRCFNSKNSLLAVTINLKDPDGSDDKLMLPNVVTPNGDGLNDYFAVDDLEGKVRPVVNLPLDNCGDQFREVSIVNRWGKQVFSSRNRYFKWVPSADNAGVYFYQLQFANKKYRGTISVQP